MDLYISKELYSMMKILSETQAADERLWAGLKNSNFFEIKR